MTTDTPAKARPRGRPRKLTYAELLRARVEAVLAAETDLIAFARLMRPDPNDPDDATRSTYIPAKHHRAVAAAFEELCKGTYKKLILTLPPRHGKTELVTKLGIAHYVGQHPDKSVIFGTYNENFSEDIGRAVRDIIRSNAYKQVFPDLALKDGSESASRLETTRNGVIAFTGRGGTITGRGGDLIVIDDPVKDRKEADSPTIRNQLWTWFTQVIMTRGMTDDARIMIVQTRWHEDDLVGRLTDPENDYYDKQTASQWKIIDIPAIAGENDTLGRAEGEALWPERFGLTYLKGIQRTDPRGFAALYQGKPTPEGGQFFRDDWFKEYRSHQLPKNLRFYCASDHAVSTAQDRDKTCLITVGLDENENIWVMPDLVWAHLSTDQAVERMLRLIREYSPMFWWAERSHISKSIGPFLRKRMAEEHTFAAIIEVVPSQDKQVRAQSIQARIAMGRVFFPAFAPWWQEAKAELLRFPNGQHDDFVDALAYIGLGLASQIGAAGRAAQARTAKPGTFGAMLKASNDARQEELNAKAMRGW